MKEFKFSVRLKYSDEVIYLPLLSIFCFALLIVRMVYTGTFEYRFMGINLFLAWVPFLIARWAAITTKSDHIIFKSVLLFLWFIFFPNAAYMITDIYHLSEFPSVPMWYDLIMLLSFAWCGLLLGFYSLKMIHVRFFKTRRLVSTLAFVFCIFFIGGIGIYFGRYQRWNSWEIITAPLSIFNELTVVLADGYAVMQMISIALLFAVFLTFVYLKLFFVRNK